MGLENGFDKAEEALDRADKALDNVVKDVFHLDDESDANLTSCSKLIMVLIVGMIILNWILKKEVGVFFWITYVMATICMAEGWLLRKGYKPFEDKMKKYKSGFLGWCYRTAKNGMVIMGILYGLISFLFWIELF